MNPKLNNIQTQTLVNLSTRFNPVAPSTIRSNHETCKALVRRGLATVASIRPVTAYAITTAGIAWVRQYREAHS